MTPVKTNWIDRLNFWQVDPHVQTPYYIHDECKYKFSKLRQTASSDLPNLTLIYVTDILLSLSYWRLVWHFCRPSKAKK